ncbi:hypothetical protein Efla_005280 [Eimeria flavescens]
MVTFFKGTPVKILHAKKSQRLEGTFCASTAAKAIDKRVLLQTPVAQKNFINVLRVETPFLGFIYTKKDPLLQLHAGSLQELHGIARIDENPETMGNSCCSVESQEPGTDYALKEFMKRAESQGIAIKVALQNGSDLNCTLSLDTVTRSLTIRSEDKMRMVPLNTIKNVLATPQQLARVDIQKDLTNDPLAVGLHLCKMESCIPLRMENEADKHNLVEMLKSFGIPPQKQKKADPNRPSN